MILTSFPQLSSFGTIPSPQHQPLASSQLLITSASCTYSNISPTGSGLILSPPVPCEPQPYSLGLNHSHILIGFGLISSGKYSSSSSAHPQPHIVSLKLFLLILITSAS